MSAISSISGAQRQARSATHWSRSAGHALGLERVVHAVGLRDRVSLRGEGDPDLVPASEGHLQRWKPRRPARRSGPPSPPSRRRAARPLRARPGEIEVDPPGGDDRAVDDPGPEAGDAAHPLGRDRIGLDVRSRSRAKTCSAVSSAIAGGQIERIVSLVRTSSSTERTSVKVARALPWPCPALARPDDVGACGVPDRGAHLAGKRSPTLKCRRASRP